jgi:hypothetical protein
MVRRVFEEFGVYERELDVERRSWESGGWGVKTRQRFGHMCMALRYEQW